MRLAGFVLATALVLNANEDFFEAARKGDAAALKVQLDKGVPVDSKWRYDQTALLMATRLGHAEAAKLLIERGADVNVKDSFYGMTPLMGAAEKGNIELLKMLIAKGATGVDQVLPMAVSSKKPEVVGALAESGKISSEALSNALGSATASGATDIVEVLKAAGAKPHEEAKLDAAVLARYVGSYRDAANSNEMKIEAADGRLRASAFGQMIPLRAIDATTFAPIPYPAIRLRFQVEGDKVTGVEFQQGQNKQLYVRSLEAK